MNWRFMRLKRLFSTSVGGSWGDEPGQGDVDAPCIRGTDFAYDTLRVSLTRAPTRSFSRREIALRAARSGDLIVKKSGGGEQQPVGRAVLYTGKESVVPTNFAALLRPNTDAEPRYLAYLLASLYTDGRTRASIKQTTGIQNLDLESFLGNEVRVPDLPRQRAIANYLDAETARIDSLIAKKRRLVEVLGERQKSQLSFSFMDQNCQPTVLKRLLAQPPCYGVLVPKFADDGVPFIRINDLPEVAQGHQPRLSIEQTQSMEYRRTIVGEGDVLLSVVGSVNQVAVVGSSSVGANVARAVCRLVPRPGIPSQLLARWLMTPEYLRQATLATGSDTAQPTLNMGDLANFSVRFPQETEAPVFLSSLEGRLQPIRIALLTLDRKITLLQEHRQSLITAAVTGELAVPGVAA